MMELDHFEIARIAWKRVVVADGLPASNLMGIAGGITYAVL